MKVKKVELEKYGRWAAKAEDLDTYVAVEWQDMQAIIAELREAREVVEEARLVPSPTPWLRRALRDYENAKFREDDCGCEDGCSGCGQ